MTTYICAIETGSFSAGANRRYERRSDNCVCGRAHRSYSAAQACMDRLRKANDAAWLSAHIHDDDGHRGTNRAEPTARDQIEEQARDAGATRLQWSDHGAGRKSLQGFRSGKLVFDRDLFVSDSSR